MRLASCLNVRKWEALDTCPPVQAVYFLDVLDLSFGRVRLRRHSRNSRFGKLNGTASLAGLVVRD